MDELEYIKRLVDEGKREEAVRELRKILKSNPRNISALIQLAYNTDSIREEKNCYKQILKVDRGNQKAKKYLKFLNKRMELSNDDIKRILPSEATWGKVLYGEGIGSYQEYTEFYAPKSASKIADDRDNIWFLYMWDGNAGLGKGFPSVIESLREWGFLFGKNSEAKESDFQYLTPEERSSEIVLGWELPPYIFKKTISTAGILQRKKEKEIVLGAHSDNVQDLRALVERCGFTILDEDIEESSIGKLRQRISEEVQIFVWRRDGGKCVICGNQENLEFDHIIPISKGGSNTARNIQLLCERCNRSKGNKIGG